VLGGLAAGGAVLVTYGMHWFRDAASSFKEVIVFTLIIPVLLWRSLTGKRVEDEE